MLQKCLSSAVNSALPMAWAHGSLNFGVDKRSIAHVCCRQLIKGTVASCILNLRILIQFALEMVLIGRFCPSSVPIS